MATKADLLAEAYRRGLLPPDKRAAYEEAQRRGLLGASPGERKRSVAENVTGFMANVNRGLGIGDELAAGAQTAVNVFAGRAPITEVGSDFRRSMAQQRQVEDQFAAERPRTAALARGTGMAATAAVPVGNTANLFAQGSRAVNAARGATVAGLEGAAYAAADRGTAGERLAAASRTARDPLTLALGAGAGSLATPKRPKAVKPVNPDVELLAKEGVQLTPGQMGGRVRRSAEDAATSLPMVGDAIAERRTEGVQTFNKAVVNRALKQVGSKLPDDMGAGTDAVKYAGDLISRGYDDAIPGKAVRADPGFADDVRDALSNIDSMSAKAQRDLNRTLQQRVTDLIGQNGVMDGATYKTVQSGLDYELSALSRSTDPDHQKMAQALKGIQGALENAARRQDPAFASKIDALDRAWAELGRIETAAARSTDLSGVFTPSQYAQAVRAGDNRIRRRGVARGEALSQDLAGAAVRVLPSKMPDSGTPARAAWGMVASAPGATIGALAGGGVGALAGIGGTGATLGAASKLYTPEAVRAANAALNARISERARREALASLAEMAAKDPNVQRLYREVAARLSRAAGVAGAAPEPAAPRNIFAEP